MTLQIEIGIDLNTNKVKYYSRLKMQREDNTEGIWDNKEYHISHIARLIDIAERVEGYLDGLNKPLDCNNAVKAE